MIYDKNLLSKGSVTLDNLLQDLVSLPFGFRLAGPKLVLLIDWSPLLSPGGKLYWIPPLPRGAVGIVVRPVWPSSRTVPPLSSPVHPSGHPLRRRSRPLPFIPAANILEGRGPGSEPKWKRTWGAGWVPTRVPLRPAGRGQASTCKTLGVN